MFPTPLGGFGASILAPAALGHSALDLGPPFANTGSATADES